MEPKPHYLKRKVITPLHNQLKQGVSPDKLALAVVFGIALGVFPVLGATSLLCAAAALLFRLNMPAIQLINYVVYPLQFVFYIPYFKMGAWLFNQPGNDLNITKILDMLKADLLGAIDHLWLANVRAIAAWCITAPVAGLLLYYVLFFFFRKAQAAWNKQNAVLE
jgi:hypothetical protein